MADPSLCVPPLARHNMTLLLQIVDDLALFYLILLLWIPFFWFVFHPAIRFWRRLGNRAFWVALPVWLIFAAGILDRAPRTLCAAAWSGMRSLGLPARVLFCRGKLAGQPNPAHLRLAASWQA